jgi:ER lumen protein retaining receptor
MYLRVWVLIFKIIKTRSCHSVSGKTTILYAGIFSCCYLVLPDVLSLYIVVLKIYFLLSIYLILGFVYGLFRKTRDKSNDTYPIHYLFVCAVLLAFCTYDFNDQLIVNDELLWRFSITLEIFAIVPQLRLIKNQCTIDKTMTCYLTMLGSYQALYICNWLYRYQREQYLEPITFTSGCFQTMIYLYFFIRIYPLLHTENQCEPIKVVQDIVHVDDIKIDLSQNEKHVVP